jgi:predicted NACHT family NTPase
LVLLDGLDEVREEDTKRVLTQIREVADKFHTNQFVITCRIAAKDYTFERFTEVEVADFDQEQIAIFAQNWFRLRDPVKAERFIQKLKENEPIRELATNPLLLTLLCLVFGETADFAANRSELYKEGLDVLLKKWDAKRNIERAQVYKNLSLHRKEDLLSQIALTTFEQKDYFFKQKTVEAYIADFIQNLRDADPDPEVLRLDSEAILKSIEAQHGLLVEQAKSIYSFSHLTFQEYFAAREIVADSAYESLVEHITEKRWREVFLLTAGMMRKADELVLLMKCEVDSLVVGDEKLQQFLGWVDEKAKSLEIPYKHGAVRAVYFEHTYRSLRLELIFRTERIKNDYKYLDLAYALERGLKHTNDNTFVHSLEHVLALVRAIERYTLQDELLYARALSLSNVLISAHNQAYNLVCIYDLAILPEIEQALQHLKEQIPNPESNEDSFKEWWEANSQSWTEQFRKLMIKHRNVGDKWEFSNAQKKLLKQYYDANKLLVDCLNSDCYVSREVRQEIEDTLLLPMSEIEKRQQGSVG